MRLLFLGAVLGSAMLTSCGEQVPAENTHSDTTKAQVDTAAVIPVEASANQEFTGGKVVDIQTGKDGYTAKLVTTANDTLFATISHANLKDHTSYKTAKVGDSLWIKGDTFTVGTELHIAVRYIK